MAEQITDKGIKGILIQYIFEIIVIFIGISISFWFDEWRNNRKDKEMERKHLSDLRDNLQQDTSLFSFQIEIGQNFINSSRKLATFKNDADILDSLNIHIDNATSYVFLQTNQTAYEEIKLTGHTSLITNDTLKKYILEHYTLSIPGCAEWANIDKNYTMSQITPEMTNSFPVVPDGSNMVSNTQKIKALRNQKLRNLLLNSVAYKQATSSVFGMTKSNAINLIQRINRELKK
jgi:hypothetical protein